ncbi:NVEALA family protein [Bacteroides fragilis str. A7 (UDC12-2)]|uniref:NVEALA family protein n=2 Tax=Bacteroides fragilis TaxID=817 RepID=A0A016AQX4_BACFG|nr:NVEALA family protein [Bacteroides fragilis str. S36L11]EYA07028.1 NVEALA family protein [Bacteroides fragilis str. S6L3]EYA63651.1 NVEALA family protein [Bacteroides fragilis str. A7 (UDC12-2)]EYE58623.1 NVEALA family protein [Bacteroides fragilis str. S6L5]
MSDLVMANVEALADSRESSADCTFGNVSYDQYSNTLHCSGNGTLCCRKPVSE